MDLTPAASALNDLFASFDEAVLQGYHTIALERDFIMNPLMRLFTLLGEHGLLMFALAAVLLCFPKTRKAGICVFGAICCGALVTNVILKDLIARPRPFEASELFRSFWTYVGSFPESDYSFPSGHATSSMAGILALFLASPWKRKWVAPAFLFPFLVAVSRNYLVAHYPSDVIAGLLIGAASAGIAYAITLGIWKLLRSHPDVPLFSFLLRFDIRHPVSSWKRKVEQNEESL
ncbi:MAG: phosphatase PAP2 family protein [Clostridia bacterium]|nr:phosphatase PAP2 family protein [Clostridia bacterium]